MRLLTGEENGRAEKYLVFKKPELVYLKSG